MSCSEDEHSFSISFVLFEINIALVDFIVFPLVSASIAQVDKELDNFHCRTNGDTQEQAQKSAQIGHQSLPLKQTGTGNNDDTHGILWDVFNNSYPKFNGVFARLSLQ